MREHPGRTILIAGHEYRWAGEPGRVYEFQPQGETEWQDRTEEELRRHLGRFLTPGVVGTIVIKLGRTMPVMYTPDGLYRVKDEQPLD